MSDYSERDLEAEYHKLKPCLWQKKKPRRTVLVHCMWMPT